MPKIVTDEKLINELLERGVEQIYPDKELLKKKLIGGESIRLYCGFDPSADSLHIGNAIAINKLSQFQDLGHEVIFLIGDFTGTIGDPADKSATRKKLTREEALKNAKDYQDQAGRYLKFDGENPAVVKYNSKWNDKLTFNDLIELSSNFTVQQMIQRDMFQKRLKDEKPIHLHEFLYPLAQGYDSVVMDVDLEVGGTDQMFNMMVGRDLQRVMNKKEKFVMTLKILADEKGNKMGKSEGNAVFLSEEPKNMYGIIMSWPDGFITPAFELATKLPMTEIKDIREKLKSGRANPRDLKMKLAFEIVKIIHGESSAKEAQEYFISTIQKKELPDEVEEIKVRTGENFSDVLSKYDLAESKGDAKRKIKQGGVTVDNEKIDLDTKIAKNMEGKVLKVGKKEFRKIKITE
ncbi:MAG: tyrosine--tRNA ligase [Patescibacteria group bacterium]|nr:tyrosine--tRNA ligase [Patescibacteria group bacterium]